MKKTVACCYLTHNHRDTVEEILGRCLAEYAEHGIDICVYDDSDDDNTKAYTESVIAEGADNLFYIDAHEVNDGSEKMLMVLKGDGLPKKYDYIWPVKDRVCFTGSCLDRLCEALEKEYDVIQIANEYQRWDISRPMNKDVYTDAGEFYRDYVVYLTNWEGTIRKRDTMLDPVDWENYESRYGFDPMDSFFHPMSVVIRLAELDHFKAGIVRFEKDERFISDRTGSAWKELTFELWIDRWINSNYLLPAVFDPYKLEAIRSQTGLAELFGSVEHMMNFYSSGIYTNRIYTKYKEVWPLITDIPVEWLELISNGRNEDVIIRVIASFEKALSDHDYLWAHRLIATNKWFELIYDKETYNILCICFVIYKKDMMIKGRSYIFDGVSSVEDIVGRYEYLCSRGEK